MSTIEQSIELDNTEGKDNAGVVTLHELDDERSQVMVQLDFVPEGVKEKPGALLSAPERRVKGES